MFEKFANKYRISSIRLPKWDYSKNGYYFITICLNDRKCVFGEVKDGQMCLSEIGDLVRGFWLEIPHHFPFVMLDEFVIMPNHIHGILIIDHEFVDGTDDDYLLYPDRPMMDYMADGSFGLVGSNGSVVPTVIEPTVLTEPNATVETGHCPVSTVAAVGSVGPIDPVVSTTDSNPKPINRFPNQGKNTISSIVGSFKSICTRTINKMNNPIKFVWQERFFEKIVRDEGGLFRVRAYIKNNPAKWERDRNNRIGLWI